MTLTPEQRAAGEWYAMYCHQRIDMPPEIYADFMDAMLKAMEMNENVLSRAVRAHKAHLAEKLGVELNRNEGQSL